MSKDLTQRLEAVEPLIARLEQLQSANAYYTKKIMRNVRNVAMMEAFGTYVRIESNGKESLISVCASDRESYIEQFNQEIKRDTRNMLLEEMV
jgi:hypothetical protein